MKILYQIYRCVGVLYAGFAFSTTGVAGPMASLSLWSGDGGSRNGGKLLYSDALDVSIQWPVWQGSQTSLRIVTDYQRLQTGAQEKTVSLHRMTAYKADILHAGLSVTRTFSSAPYWHLYGGMQGGAGLGNAKRQDDGQTRYRLTKLNSVPVRAYAVEIGMGHILNPRLRLLTGLRLQGTEFELRRGKGTYDEEVAVSRGLSLAGGTLEEEAELLEREIFEVAALKVGVELLF